MCYRLTIERETQDGTIMEYDDLKHAMRVFRNESRYVGKQYVNVSLNEYAGAAEAIPGMKEFVRSIAQCDESYV